MLSWRTVTRGPLLIGLVAMGLAVGCGGDSGPVWPDKPGPKVVASFPPIYSFALNVAGDDAVVKTVMSSQGPHDFDPTAADARLLSRADVFLINGLTLDEQIAEKMKNGSGNRNLKVVELGELIDKKQLEAACGCAHEDEHGHGHNHVHTTDPHVWLGLELAVKQVNGIRDALKEADPGHADNYERRAAEYAARLAALRAEGVEKLKGKKDRKFVTFHGSLAYFARSFDLEIAEVIQKVPGKEPSAKELEDVIKACIENKVRVIAVEPQYTSQSSAKRLLTELKQRGIADAQLIEIDPLETAREADLNAGWYEARMRANIDALEKALK